jgi:hypothetical protein
MANSTNSGTLAGGFPLNYLECTMEADICVCPFDPTMWIIPFIALQLGGGVSLKTSFRVSNRLT